MSYVLRESNAAMFLDSTLTITSLLLLACGAKMSTEMTVEQKRPAAFAAAPLPKDDVKPPLCSQPLSSPSLFFPFFPPIDTAAQ